MDLSKAILNVLQQLNKPLGVEEIAFRIRSTSTVVKEQLEKLSEVHLVKRIDAGYSIEESAKNSGLESLYSY